MSRSELVLALDTSGSRSGAALVDGTEPRIVLASDYLEPGDFHAESLAESVSAVLDRVGASVADLGALAVTRGPGSFTGVRVGLALARGLALVDDLSVVGVGSLELAALAAAGDEPRLCVLIAAGRDKVYAAAYERVPGGLRELAAAAVVPDRDVAGFVAAADAAAHRCAVAAEHELLARLGASCPALDGHLTVDLPEQRADVLAAAGAERLAAGGGQSAERVLPLYGAEVTARKNRNRVVVSPEKIVGTK